MIPLEVTADVLIPSEEEDPTTFMLQASEGVGERRGRLKSY